MDVMISIGIGMLVMLVILSVMTWVIVKQEEPAGGYPLVARVDVEGHTLTGILMRPWVVIRRIATDRARRDPDIVPIVGIHIFVGRQGAGKTLSAVRWARQIAEKYPNAKCLANLKIKQGTGWEPTPRWIPIRQWGDVQAEEGRSTITVIDEIQTWASSMQSHKVPPELLGLSTQQRKRRMAIIATAQVPTRVAKPLREQCYRWYLCTRVFGVVHVVSVFDGDQLDPETGQFTGRPIRRVWYVATDADRAAYETHEIIADVDVTNYAMWQPTGSDNVQTDDPTRKQKH